MKDARDALKKAVQTVRDLGPTITIDTGAIKRSISSSLFGINHRYSNFGYGTVNPDGTVKSDFAELYQQAGFGSLRYPGGTISNNLRVDQVHRRSRPEYEGNRAHPADSRLLQQCRAGGLCPDLRFA